MNYKIDLHVHSYMSDGTLSPKEVIKLAAEKNVKAIALTDHNSIDGLNEAAETAMEYNISFLKGIEMTTVYKDGRKLHILGLGIDVNNAAFLKMYTRIKTARQESIEKILKTLKNQRINIDIEDLREHSLNQSLDRYDIHKYFVRNGICTDAQEIWDKYLNPIPYGEDEKIYVEEALDVINKSEGISFLAHYNKKIGFHGLTKIEMEKNIKYLIDMGLNGIEKFYPSFVKDDIEFLDYLIDKYNLDFSGGSDFHGKNRPEALLGIGHNNSPIPYSVYENIVQKLGPNSK